VAVGALRVGVIAAELEIRAKAGDRDSAVELVRSLERAVADTAAALKEESAAVRSGATGG